MAVQVKDIVTVSPEAEDGMSPLQSFLWEESESLTVAENPVDAEEETQVREEDWKKRNEEKRAIFINEVKIECVCQFLELCLSKK